MVIVTSGKSYLIQKTTHQPSAGRLTSVNWPVAILLYLQGRLSTDSPGYLRRGKVRRKHDCANLAARRTGRTLVKSPPTSRHITPKPPGLLSQMYLRLHSLHGRIAWSMVSKVVVKSSMTSTTTRPRLTAHKMSVCRAVSVVDMQIETGCADFSSACSRNPALL